LNAFIRRRLLYLNTVRYLNSAQIWHRVLRSAKKRWRWHSGLKTFDTPAGRLSSLIPLYSGLPELSSEELLANSISAAADRAIAVDRNNFRFLNESVDYGNQPDWHDFNQSHLWRFHLHYFDYLTDLLIWSKSSQTAKAHAAYKSLVVSWIDGNPPFKGDGWHSYTISVRLVNWLNAAIYFESSEIANDESFSRQLLSSIYEQARALSADLEFDVRGNHLIKNLRALLFIAPLFEGGEFEKWIQKSLGFLEKEVAEQILADGGHFERSPGYHLAVLKDILEIALWMQRNLTAPPDWLDEALRRMLEYLATILGPDDQVPLLKDTAWGSAVEPADLLAAGAIYFGDAAFKISEDFGLYPFLLFGRSGWNRFKNWPVSQSTRIFNVHEDSGHYVIKDKPKGDYLILDAGKPCPDYLPAHAHADMFSYEFAANGQRVVVDSGVYEYSAGSWRDYFRSTRAHNTLAVEGADQSEVWDSFRVARRARPGRVTWQSDDGNYALVQGSHDGYCRLSVPVVHRRTFVWQKQCFLLIVDEVLGQGKTSASSYLHINPELTFKPIAETVWKIEECRIPIWLTAFEQSSHSISKGQKEPFCQGWYSEAFGQIEPNEVLALHKKNILPFCFGYVISMDHPASASYSKKSGDISEIVVAHKNQTYYLKIGSGKVSYSQ